MKLQTCVDFQPLADRFTYQSKFFCIGSCFATEVGGRLEELGFDIAVNPFGVLYNPASIAAAVERLTSHNPFVEDEVICSQGKYTSFSHHSRFDRDTAEEFLSCANAALERDAVAFGAAEVCIVTLGTAWVYRHVGRDVIVSNCHKIHPNEFVRTRLEVEEVATLLADMVMNHPEKRWIFTVSPVRHIKDTLHGNQLSKATLLLAVDKVVQTCPNAEYFPAYEIMMDELRGYRFYAEDMVHPSSQAVGYIFDRFCEYAIDASQNGAMEEARRRIRSQKHIPIH
ncbi:MAG: GSCFA domain-containing protein [Bacteroidales bacterium]|nr:GSCFA domain-containing protein [Bacteroidales bacterium]